VTFAGQMIERKGVADLLLAWRRLDSWAREAAELLLVGDDIQNGGSYRVAMEALAAELRCPARFLGFRSDVDDWITASDIAVVPSHVEPLGNATLEAMSHARPVIGSAVGGIPEMVLNERTGLLVPPRSPEQLASALSRLIGDTAVRNRFGDEGRRRCEAVFSLEAHTRGVLRSYDRVLSREAAATPA